VGSIVDGGGGSTVGVFVGDPLTLGDGLRASHAVVSKQT
jgi:hypothetical protein